MTHAEFRSTLKSLGITQRSLAERLGVNTATVNRWAQGTLAVPEYAAYALTLHAMMADKSKPE